MIEFLLNLKVFISNNLAALTLTLFVMLALHIIFKTQKRGDFDFAEMLKDESGKKSVTRLGTLVSLVISSWVMVFLTMKSEGISDNHLWVFGIYIAVWSGAKVVEKAIDAWYTKGAPPIRGMSSQTTVTETKEVLVTSEAVQAEPEPTLPLSTHNVKDLK